MPINKIAGGVERNSDIILIVDASEDDSINDNADETTAMLDTIVRCSWFQTRTFNIRGFFG